MLPLALAVATVVATPVERTNGVISKNFQQDYKLESNNHFIPVNRGSLLVHPHAYHLIYADERRGLAKRTPKPLKFPFKIPGPKGKKKKPFGKKAKKPFKKAKKPFKKAKKPVGKKGKPFGKKAKPFAKPFGKKAKKGGKPALALSGPGLPAIPAIGLGGPGLGLGGAALAFGLGGGGGGGGGGGQGRR